MDVSKMLCLDPKQFLFPRGWTRHLAEPMDGDCPAVDWMRRRLSDLWRSLDCSASTAVDSLYHASSSVVLRTAGWQSRYRSIPSILSRSLMEICPTHLTMPYNTLTGTLKFADLPKSMKDLSLCENSLSANPTKGHLSVVGWTSTPVLGEAKGLPNSRRVSVMAPTLLMATARWWVRTSTQPLGRFRKPPNYFQGENLLGGETREDIF
ncbi:hypothetical protein XU18_4178 [Perkinsela sp. CCAP 1560/4]|nr:hypothetical protein XU18_4178 [Perkinsela sp. CCAP 1560/4]|eukprot:KNH04638.1 hypothetical protein XU18_4178 [Perkinsela sp. CCAP 1560/4]